MVSVLWTIRIPDERSEQKGAMNLRGNGRRGESGGDGVDDGGWNRDLSHVFDRVNASARLPPNSIKSRARRVPDQTLTKRAWEVYGSPFHRILKDALHGDLATLLLPDDSAAQKSVYAPRAKSTWHLIASV